MAAKNERYINFPIQLLEGFLLDSKECLNNIFDYGVYEYYLKLEFEDDSEKFKKAGKYFRITKFGNKEKSFKNGENLFNCYDQTHSPKAGISTEMIWDFYKNEKSEFEKVCLLGFLGIKSILLNKPYCKMTNNFWFARMDGNPKAINSIDELSDEIKKYSNEYQTRKIKNELIDNWGLVHYSRYTRGFYVSFAFDFEGLVYEAEKRRKSTKEKHRKFTEKITLERVLNQIELEML